jgi:D-alanyl-D-alanine carboxypeptidase
MGLILGLFTLSLPIRLLRCLAGLLVLAFTIAPAIPLEAKTVKPVLRGTAAAAPKASPRRTAARRVVRMPASPTDPAKDAALVIDGATGKVLYARNETAERHPASLTKMMTLYLLFEALKQGKVTMETPLAVSAHAVAQKPTKLNLRKGETISVDTAIRAIVIRSANDVAVVIAEALGGTEGHFAEVMTQKAHELGMKDTNFHNASGLPDPLQITTAADLALLARHVAYDFPQYFPYFSLAGFTYKGTWFPTHDNLIGRYDGADGIKTGYTNASGFNLVTSVVREGRFVVGVVMGGRTAIRRDLEMVRILDDTFDKIAAAPTLVAAHAIPWEQSGSQPVLASLSVAPGPAVPAAQAPVTPSRARNPFAGLTALVSPALGGAHEEDEDTAEKKVAPDEDPSVRAPLPLRSAAPEIVASSAAPPAPSAAIPGNAKALAAKARPAPAIRPSPRPNYSASVALVARAMPAPPLPRPSLASDTGEGDTGAAAVPASSPGRRWTIQIGAFADQALAKVQLASYAEKARDILGQAAQIVTPAQSADGHTVWRARFGLFEEDQAREVCLRLTQRGQSCFAAIASAR